MRALAVLALGLTLGAVAFLAILRSIGPSGPGPGAASVPASARRASRTPAPDPGPGPAGPRLPLFSESWIDDSGYEYARTHAQPPRDPRSLGELRDGAMLRFERGLAAAAACHAADDLTTPAGRAKAVQGAVLEGLLRMATGEFEAADACFARVPTLDPRMPPSLLANVVALRGMAALRRGEADNCVACCTGASCIYPLAAEAVHRNRDGSAAAIEHFAAYLRERPDDLGVRWLLNLAHMTLGTYPEGVPADLLIPREPARGSGSFPRLPNVAAEAGLAARGENMAGGLIADDFDGDGRLDVFYSTIDPARGCDLFINKGDGTFDDRSDRAGIRDQVGAENCVHADYDNDGDLDVLLLRGAWEFPLRLSLLRNDGTGAFSDATAAAGLDEPIATEAAAWADYDGDGDLDLYVGGECRSGTPGPGTHGRLYRNKGDGTFADVAEVAGVRNDRFVRGVAWGDYDDDGDPDLFVSNQGSANRLYRNDGAGTFVDVADEAGVTGPIASYSCWFWDYDNDGRLDLFVTGTNASLQDLVRDHLGLPNAGERPALYHNEGDGRFADVTAFAGLDRAWVPMGCNFGDLDGDGFLDFYLGTGAPAYSFLVPNVLMHNVGGLRFEDVTVPSGTGHLQKGHGTAMADYDGDGDLDLLVECGGATPGDRAHSALFRNPGTGAGEGSRNRWLKLRLRGVRSNRYGVGARIRIDATGPDGPRAIRRDLNAGASFGNNPLTPTIGLGRSGPTVDLEITWPRADVRGPARQVVRGLPVDSAVAVTEGRDGFERIP